MSNNPNNRKGRKQKKITGNVMKYDSNAWSPLLSVLAKSCELLPLHHVLKQNHEEHPPPGREKPLPCSLFKILLLIIVVVAHLSHGRIL